MSMYARVYVYRWPCHTAGLLYVEDRCIYRDQAEEVATSRQAYAGTNGRMAQVCEYVDIPR